MTDLFDAALAFTLRPENEGQPLHRSAGDPGGSTAFGLTLATMRTWYAAHGTARSDHAILAAMSGWGPDTALVARVYEENYWRPVRGDDLPPGVGLFVFDHGVTAGPRSAALVLQRALPVEADGDIGPITIAAAAAAERLGLINRLHAEAETDYRSKADFSRFGHGWLLRNSRRMLAALDAGQNDIVCTD